MRAELDEKRPAVHPGGAFTRPHAWGRSSAGPITIAAPDLSRNRGAPQPQGSAPAGLEPYGPPSRPGGRSALGLRHGGKNLTLLSA